MTFYERKPFVFLIIGLIVLLVVGGTIKRYRVTHPAKNGANCFGQATCAGKNPLIKNITILQKNGGRARFSPDGQTIVFDRKNADGYYQLYLSDLRGNVTSSLTAGKQGITQKNNGNAVYDPSGKYIIFISEAAKHLADNVPAEGDPGIGLFSNIWATDASGANFWQLTFVPIPLTKNEGVPALAVVNPLFSPDGTKLIWTELYGYTPGSCNDGWGRWRLMEGNFSATTGAPQVTNQHVLYQPTVTQTANNYVTGNYVTAMSFVDTNNLLVAGNLSGQHPYGMDQYQLNLNTNQVTDLTDTPDAWEEDAKVSPLNHNIVYMTNIDSPTKLDICKAWYGQTIQRDYYMMNSDGSNKQKLTYFNDPTAPEYTGFPTIVAESDISPDGKYQVGVIGIKSPDNKAPNGSFKNLSDYLIEFSTPQ